MCYRIGEMPKFVKYTVIAIAALAGLLLIAIGIIAATFDPNDYKPLAIRMVQEKTQRTLRIPGEIRLSFFPTIGADLGRVSISERNGTAEFVSIESAKVSLALIPLLSKQLVVDQVRLDGLRATIRQFKDGTSNVDDLLAKDETAGGGAPQSEGRQAGFDIDSVHIGNAHIVYDDQRQDRRLELAGLNLDTGRIANGVPGKLRLTADIKANKPEVNARIAMNSGFTLDTAGQRYALRGLDADIKGDLVGFSGVAAKLAGNADLAPAAKRFILDGIKFSASGKRATQTIDVGFDIPRLALDDKQVSGSKLHGETKIAEAARTITVNVAAPSFEGSPQALKLPSLDFNAMIRQTGLDIDARLSGMVTGDIGKLLFSSPQLTLALSGKQNDKAIRGTMNTPFSIDMTTRKIDLSAMTASFTLPNPGGGMLSLKVSGNAGADLARKTAHATLKGDLDESAFDTRLVLTAFSPAAYAFDIGIDKLDLDRYKGKPQPGPPSASVTAPAKRAEPEKPLDLSILQNLHANGSVRIGTLKAANIRASNLRMDMRAAGGTLDIGPFSASLYGGSVAGAMSVTAGTPARVALRQNFTGIHIGPLLKDAIEKNWLEGKGNVRLDVVASGTTASQFKQALHGSASLELRDGALHGINVAQVIRNAKARIDAIKSNEAPQSGTGSSAEKTDFSEMSGGFKITNGIAHNEDLNIKSPLIRIGGAGDVDIGKGMLDYLARTTVVTSLQGQGGPELQALKGLTIPVRLSGPFDAISWRIDFAGIAEELARKKIDEKKEEVASKAQKALGEKKAKAQEQLKEQLKGLFGK